MLYDAAGDVVRAAKYEVSTDAGLWAAERPGNNLWPRTPGGDLGVVVAYSTAWTSLGSVNQDAFKTSECTLHWTASATDTTYPGLSGAADRRYASNAYGMARTTYQ